MMGLSAKSLRLFAVACALFFAAAAGALAKEQQFTDYNCAITFPDDWQVMTNMTPQQGIIVAYKDPNGNRCVILQIYNEKPAGPLDDRFIAGYEKGIVGSGGGDRLSGKYIEVGGIKCYERLGTIDSHGKLISTIYQLVPGEGRYFNLLAMRFDGDANDDPEIRQVIGTFRFIHPFVPTYAPNSNSAAYRIGEWTGRLLVIIFVVGIVIYAIRSYLKPRAPSLPPRSPPSPPPPLPPGVQ